LKNSINIEKVEHMKYICDKIISITKLENSNIYFKTRVVNKKFG
jgi:hypothetical protein